MAGRFDDRRQWYPPSRPREVEGGLKARTARGSIGSSWWSRRFLDVLESFAMGGRLTRGRTYARKGQVISLDVAPGEVRSSVQGSRARPYEVVIKLKPFGELVWAKAEIALAEQALPAAKLLAGEVPPELDEIFIAAGAPLFPTSASELDQRCSCPDWGVPCKHLAATFYLLAEAFDDDPFLILRWRGRDREPLLGRLRELRGDRAGRAVATDEAARVVAGAALALAGLEFGDRDEASSDPAHFWQPPAPLPPRPASLVVDPDLVLRQLATPSTALGGDRLVTVLQETYRQFGGD